MHFLGKEVTKSGNYRREITQQNQLLIKKKRKENPLGETKTYFKKNEGIQTLV